MSTLSAYLQTWRLKLSHTKAVTEAFYLNNREAKHELKVYTNDRLLSFCPNPTYLGVKVDRLLKFRHHLVSLRKKLFSRVTVLRRPVGSGWGADAKTFVSDTTADANATQAELKVFSMLNGKSAIELGCQCLGFYPRFWVFTSHLGLLFFFLNILIIMSVYFKPVVPKLRPAELFLKNIF